MSSGRHPAEAEAGNRAEGVGAGVDPLLDRCLGVRRAPQFLCSLARLLAVPKLTPEQVREWLTASCAAQGVPVRVVDPQVLAKVAALLPLPDVTTANARSASGRGAGRRQSRQTAATRKGSRDRAPD